VKPIAEGVTGAYKLGLAFPDGKTLDVKWKEVPRGSGDGWNNSPRKEIAAYAIQRWFLDEADYVVPTPVPRCIALDRYAAVERQAEPTLPGTRCVLGIAVAWMEDVTPDGVWDPARFARDPHYAAHVADFNLLTYLIEHKDGRRGNFLLSKDPADPRVFAVDNGISFDAFPWNFLVTNWHRIRVPWLRREAVNRLRAVSPAKIAALGTLAELAADEDGILRPVVPPGPNLDPDEGARIAPGRVQFGLTDDDIEDLEERIEELIEDVDEGDVPLR
jgi:hypothetical protein